MNRRGFLACMAGAAGVALAGSNVNSAAAWAPPRWDRDRVWVYSTIPQAWYVGTAGEAWDDSSGLELITTYSKPSSTSVIKIDYGPLDPGVLGYCQRYYNSEGRVRAAQVTINQTINLSVFEKARRIALIRHEIGHALGFNHSTTGEDVMYGKIIKGGPMDLSALHNQRLVEVYGR